MNHKCVFILLILLSPFSCISGQDDEGLLYGEIRMKNGRSYTGHIRWGKDKVMWNDLLYAEKEMNPVRYFLSGEEVARLELVPERKRYNWSFVDLWDPEFTEDEHALKVAFGYISYLDYSEKDEISVGLKDGIRLVVTDDEDMDDDLIIYMQDGKQKELEARDLRSIRFIQTPSRLGNKHGAPIYGTVMTGNNEFSGYLIWDGECCLTDYLHGRENRNKRPERHAYSTIRSIEKLDRAFLVTFKNGKEKKLCCTGNLNTGSLDVIVKDPAFGQAEIPAREIDKVLFRDPQMKAPVYKSYQPVSRIQGRILTHDNRSVRGQIIYDLDEAFDCELLDGESNDIEYRIPFNIIKRIEPVDDEHSRVMLSGGRSLLLTDHMDVSRKNSGCLVETTRNQYIYIPWKEIREIRF